MKVQAICRLEHNGEIFLATKSQLREAIPQVEAVLKAFSILKEAGVSIGEAEFYIPALDGTNCDDNLIGFAIHSADEAVAFLTAVTSNY